jgi:Holliday junction resolvase RusA-like endonuclease
VIELQIHGRPHGKGRPRFANGRVFTDSATEAAEARVERAWENAGKPRLDGPLVFELEMFIARPKTHRRRDGSLSTEGERNPWPCRKPDADNALKLAMDALTGRAYRDDVDVVHAWVLRRWAPVGHAESTIIRIRRMDAPSPALFKAAA